MIRRSRFVVVVAAACCAGLLSGCFLLVTSGIRREIPPGARAATAGLLGADEEVVAAWDGSVLQDGGLLAVLTDQRLLKRSGAEVSALDLRDVQSIIVNEDDGAVDVVSAGGRLSLPLRSSDERRAFARLIQTAVQKRKKSAHQDEPPAPQPLTEAAPPSTP